MAERDLFSRAIDAHMHAENESQRRALGILMRKRIAAIINVPRKEEPYAHLIDTKGKKFADQITIAQLEIPFELESDSEDVTEASGLSIRLPELGETLLIHETGEAEIRRTNSPPSALHADAKLTKMIEYYGILGVIESQFPIPEQPTGPFPSGVVPFTSEDQA